MSASCSLSWLLLPGWMVDLSFSSPVASTDRPSVRFSSASMAVVRGFTGWGLDGTTTKQHTHVQSGIQTSYNNSSVAASVSYERLSGDVRTSSGCQTGGPKLFNDINGWKQHLPSSNGHLINLSLCLILLHLHIVSQNTPEGKGGDGLCNEGFSE